MVKLAVEGFGGKLRGQQVEVVSADPQNKPEIGVSIATKWFEEWVDAIVDVPNSSIAFALSELAKQRNKLFFATAPSQGDPARSASRCRGG